MIVERTPVIVDAQDRSVGFVRHLLPSSALIDAVSHEDGAICPSFRAEGRTTTQIGRLGQNGSCLPDIRGFTEGTI